MTSSVCSVFLVDTLRDHGNNAGAKTDAEKLGNSEPGGIANRFDGEDLEHHWVGVFLHKKIRKKN